MTTGRLFDNISIKPGLIAFDLDCTLWPFDCDIYDSQVFHKNGDMIYDENNYPLNILQDSNNILKSIKQEKDVLLACASRTPSVETARQLVHLNGWDKLFDHMEIYPDSKIVHFQTLQRKTKIPYNKMIFFDDLQWNIKEVKSLGVHSHHVPNGVHTGAFRKALKEYEQFWSCK
ncbi:unnamed protein product [Schistosoma spindalis]|nr:unnamed protein product [Schistosoma spindale]